MILVIKNDWEGVIIYGVVCDVVVMFEMDLGIKVLGISFFKIEKCGVG